MDNQSVVLFSGSSHLGLARGIADCLRLELGKVSLSTFPDGEIGIEILDNVRGRDVFVLQTIARRPNHYLMELLIFVDALKRASARSISAVIPFFGYSRQDRRAKGKRVAITAKLVADLLQTAGVDRVLTMDLHAEQIQGFFDVPVDNLSAAPLLQRHVAEMGIGDYVAVAPDLGSIKMVEAFALEAGVPYAIVDKRRKDAERVEPGVLIGTVRGKKVVLVDDMVSTGETLKIAAQVCKKAGATNVYAVVTHAVRRADMGSAIEKMLVTDTIPDGGIPLERDLGLSIQSVSVAPLFGQAIASMVEARSVSSLSRPATP